MVDALIRIMSFSCSLHVYKCFYRLNFDTWRLSHRGRFDFIFLFHFVASKLNELERTRSVPKHQRKRKQMRTTKTKNANRQRAIGEAAASVQKKTSNEKWKRRLSHTSNGRRAYEKSTDYIIGKNVHCESQCSTRTQPSKYARDTQPVYYITESTAFATKPIIHDYYSHVILACALRHDEVGERESGKQKKKQRERET